MERQQLSLESCFYRDRLFFGKRHPLGQREAVKLLHNVFVLLSPSGLQQHPVVSQVEPAPCV